MEGIPGRNIGFHHCPESDLVPWVIWSLVRWAAYMAQTKVVLLSEFEDQLRSKLKNPSSQVYMVRVSNFLDLDCSFPKGRRDTKIHTM